MRRTAILSPAWTSAVVPATGVPLRMSVPGAVMVAVSWPSNPASVATGLVKSVLSSTPVRGSPKVKASGVVLAARVVTL